MILEVYLDVFRTVVTVGRDPLFLSKSYMNGDTVPGTIRKILFLLSSHFTLKGVTMLENGNAMRILCVPVRSAMCRAD